MNDQNDQANAVEQFLSNMDEGFLVLDVRLNIVSFNEAVLVNCVKFLNKNIERGMSVFSITSPERSDIDRQTFARVLSGKTAETEYSISGQDNHNVCFNALLMPIFNTTRVAEGIFITIRNVTKKVSKEKQFRFDCDNLSALINNIRGLMWSVDRDYKLVAFNATFKGVVMHMSGQTVCKGSDSLLLGFSEDQNLRFKKRYDRVFAGETFIETEYTNVPADYWSEISFYPITEGHEVVGAVCFSHDITSAKKAEEKLLNSEHKFRALIENSHDGISLIGADGKLMYVTPSTKRILGYEPEELLGCDPAAFTHPDDLKPLLVVLIPLMSNYGETVTASYRMKHKNGSWRMVRSNITNMLNEPAIKAVVFNFEDVTDRVLAEQQLVHANRLYAFISQINHAIVHVSDEQTLFREACNIAIDLGKFSMAWVGLFDIDNRKIDLVAQGGIPLEDVSLFSAVYEHDGPQDQVIKSNDFYVCNDVQRHLPLEKWKHYAAARGIGSCMVLPLKKSGQIIGTFNLYASESDFFNDEEVNLLKGITADISYALDVFEKERLRKTAEQTLKQSKARLLQAQSIAHFGSWSLSFSTGIAVWSDEACRIYGLPLEENMQTYENWVSFLHPEDIAEVMKITAATRDTMSRSAFQHRIVLRDGTVKHIYSQTDFEFDENNRPIGLYGVAHDVTEQKIAEDKIINANRLYSFISGINQTIVHVKDEQTLFDEACRIATTLGKFALAWIGFPDYQSCTPKRSQMKLFAETSGFNSSMVLAIKKSGKVYATLNLFSCQQDLFDAEEIRLLEEVVGDISFALDVFEKEISRAKAEKEIAHSQLRLVQAQSIAHVGSWELQFSVGMAEWSGEHCRIYGLNEKDNVHSFESWLSFIHPDDRDMVVKTISNSDASFRDASIDHRIVRADGSVRHIYMHSQFDLNEAGEPIGLYGVSHDITESKEIQSSLMRSEANLRMILDLIPQSIFVKDFEGRYVFVNKTFARLFGLTPKDLVNRSLLDPIFIEEEGLAILKQDREVMLTGVTKVIPEMTFTTAKGEIKIFYTIKVPYTATHKSQIGVLGIANDITEQKRTESERAQMITDIVQRNKDLEQFSYIVSHNLRGPVANILGITEIMQFLESGEEEMKTMTEALAVATKKLDTVIKDLNMILQIKHTINENRETVYFAELLEDIKTGLENTVKTPEVTITGDFSQNEKMHTLKSYLYSIFFNLISNSIKYRRPGIRSTIEVSSYERLGKTCLVFKDNGLGINLEKNSGMLFGLYKRFHHHVEGKGMGLYMVKTQVEALGGKISISSELNKGTEFIIEFENN